MEGRQDEVLARKRSEQDERNGRRDGQHSKTSGASYPNKSRRFVDENGKVFVLIEETANIAASVLTPAELHTLADKYGPSEISDSELSMALVDGGSLKVSVNWNEFIHPHIDSSILEITLLTAEDSHKFTCLNTEIGFWFLYSGATVHLSPERSDFFF